MDERFSPEVQEALLTMFMSDGWRYFIEDVTSNLDGVNSLDNVVGEQQLGFRQGQVSALRGIVAYEDAIKSAVEDEMEITV